jgi:ectoine hydroxylase-related dioxygenase (phytanoyl-CoA dioxygenase family)
MVTNIGPEPAPHPWNRDFRWRDAEPPFTLLTAEQARRFDEQGFLLLPDVFTADEVAAVRATVDRFEAEADEHLRRRHGGRLMIAEAGAITFATALVTRSPELAAFARHPGLAALGLDLVGPDVNLYWDQSVYKKPEKPRRFPWHQDNGYAYIEPQQYLTCWVPLTDAHAANGCPQVAPGVHRRGTLDHTYVEPLGFECFAEPPVAPQVVEAPVGSVVVFSSLTPHLTGPNTTDDVRKAYILQYAPAGAELLHGDPADGPPARRSPCDDPARQFPVARHGRPVAHAPTA